MADERAAELLLEIEQDLLGDEVSTTKILQKCIVLGGRANSERLRDWARQELNGYPSNAVFPDYRKIEAVIHMDILVGDRPYQRRAFSSAQLPKAARDRGINEIVKMKQSIGEIEDLAYGNKGSVDLTTPFAPLIGREFDRAVGMPHQQVQSVYWSTTSSAMLGIVERVRTSLAELISELVAHMPIGESTPSGEVIDRAVTFVVTGDRASFNVNSVAST